MKKTLLLFVLLSALCSAKASDTLTIRQIFNFDVGDTFDYAFTSSYTWPNNGGTHSTGGAVRYLITGKTLSADSQTIVYYRARLYPQSFNYIDTVIYPNPDSTIFNYDTLGTTYGFSFQTGVNSSNHITNSFSGSTTDNGYTHIYTEGMGKTYHRLAYGNPIDGGGEYDTTLIYFTHRGVRNGRPYYWIDSNQNGQSYIHYTPLPETCAIWNMTSGPLLEQIRTGTIVYQSGHKYVQMIYRSYDPGRHNLTNDSVLGYFYNDSTVKSVYFVETISSAPRELYNFHSTSSGLSCTGGFVVHQDHIGGYTLAHWTSQGNCTSQYGDYCFFDYIEGIGGTAGLINVTKWGGRYTSQLNSLCVCGNVIYPDTATTTCTLLTAINDPEENFVSIHLYPNPTTDHLHLSFPGAHLCSAHLTLTDLLGQTVYSSAITDPATTHDISYLPSGIYTWRIVSDNTILKTGKVIKQ